MEGSRGVSSQTSTTPLQSETPKAKSTGKSRSQRKVTIANSLRKFFGTGASKTRSAQPKPLHQYQLRPTTAQLHFNSNGQRTTVDVSLQAQKLGNQGYNPVETSVILGNTAHATGNNMPELSSRVEAVPQKGSLQHQWLSWAVNDLMRKGYPPAEANNIALNGMKWAGPDIGKFQNYIQKAPLTAQMQQHQDFQWAIGSFAHKGYAPQTAGQSIQSAMHKFAGNRDAFIQWVKNAPPARPLEPMNQGQYVKDILRPSMQQIMLQKGFSEDNANEVIDTLIRQAGGTEKGNMAAVWEGVLLIKPTNEGQESPPPQNLARLTTAEAYNVLGLKEGASARDVKKAFHKLSNQLHPDKHVGKPEAEVARLEEQYKQVVKAHDQITKQHIK
ncbi:J domain-containing protein [Parendozoicomonas haliclonae]|uniref:Chaperone protein DnaJ n=1 Tax=Parendozoicomonas haliclonae TaxID=1960125 RepID=A0A1X7AQB1_9GAMM|nr:J domain-containing protein [Parendozoicomonas haliclonae]SMA50494.1 Chaperone protein DnaJ [Parendozoicomonas haliclonae]